MAPHQTALVLHRVFILTALSVITQSRKRRFYQRPLNTRRAKLGHHRNLIQELWDEDDSFFRLDRNTFNHLLNAIGDRLSHAPTHRQPISPDERLSMTLGFLASGASQKLIALDWRVGRSTLHSILKETCQAIWDTFKDDVVPFPTTPQEWKKISEEFKAKTQFPNCLGAIDGKHVKLQAPPLAGSTYYNYKHFHSLNLMAVCDANLCFTFVDIGSPGRNSDGGVFAQTALGAALSDTDVVKTLSLPPDQYFDGCGENRRTLPHVFVADEAFPLRRHIMRPFPGQNLTERQEVYNYRLCRARRLIENAFGVLTQRWRFLRGDLIAFPENAVLYVQAAIVLHNWLRKNSVKSYCPPKYVDHVGINGEIINGEWRDEAARMPSGSSSCLQNIDKRHMASNNHTESAVEIRESYADFFISPNGEVEWQHRHVRRGRDNP
ncbi:putative nuclease HARBI1 [Amphiura filiformis]|uniref:putative nuclease HARBI1 n=1 Tax=Amphiura filiformis TaxID=82378 RepID=UPI003B21A9D9